MTNLFGYSCFTDYIIVNANNDEPLQRFGSEKQAIEFAAKLNKRCNDEKVYVIAQTHSLKTEKISG